MNRIGKTIAILIGLGICCFGVAQDCFQDASNCSYEALNVGSFAPTIDGNLDDWVFAEGVTNGKDYWEANGEQYSGDDDLSMTWYVLWDSNNLYVAIDATDDKHQNTKSGNQIWDGDGVQFSIDPTAEKAVYNGHVYEYGYALAAGVPSVARWSEHPSSEGENSEFAIVRDDNAKKTYYEIRIPVGDIAPADLKENGVLGWAIILNDSDSVDSQGGWVGWGSAAIVFGKEAPPMGDLILSPETLAVLPRGKLATTWASVKQ